MIPEKSQSSNEMASELSDTRQTLGSSFKHFFIGASLSGLPIFVYLSMSMDMSHVTLAQVGGVKLAISITAPIICGLLAAVFKQRFTDLLSAIFESGHLPF